VTSARSNDRPSQEFVTGKIILFDSWHRFPWGRNQVQKNFPIHLVCRRQWVFP